MKTFDRVNSNTWSGATIVDFDAVILRTNSFHHAVSPDEQTRQFIDGDRHDTDKFLSDDIP